MKVRDICTREVVAAGRATSVRDAASLMRERHVGSLVIVDGTPGEAQVVGIVTDRDLVVEALARGLDAERTEIGRFADGALAAVGAEAGLDEAIGAMRRKGVRRLLVAGESGELFGIVSSDDVLDAMAHEMSEMARAIRGGPEREAAERAPLLAANRPAARVPEYSFE